MATIITHVRPFPYLTYVTAILCYKYNAFTAQIHAPINKIVFVFFLFFVLFFFHLPAVLCYIRVVFECPMEDATTFQLKTTKTHKRRLLRP